MSAVPSRWSELSPSGRRVALEVLVHGPLARTELAQRLDLSTPSLTRLTRPLIDLGVLHEVDDPGDQAVRPGGRPPQPLDVDPGLEHFIGVKLTGSHAYAVLTDLRAQIVRTAQSQVDDHRPEAVVALLARLVDEVRGERPALVSAVGIGLGGIVNDGLRVGRAPFLGWRDVPLGDLLRTATGLPVVLANDLDALMEAEHWFGAGRDVSDFVALTIGAAVGCGLVVHDRLVHSVDSGLGLLGHFPLDPLGPACPDGHRGCANALLSMDSIQAQASLAVGRALSYDEVLDLALAADPIADQVVGNAARAFGVLVADVVNIAQPQRVVLTGEGIRLAEVGWDRLVASIRAHRNPEAGEVDLHLVKDDPMLWARGAAAVAIQRTVLDTLP
ncbi:ROK family transcriptional regulator [Cellulomonas citrea]|uniref:ROK family transcriptional regulator n=1 Tax=Cellulomonas citrea TaxID=1909423 RepID=UPI00135ADC58|nr:ROK family transcriptional regulator [Cellulomonas citrea]